MADKKISALTASSTPLAGTEVLPIVQSSATVKVAVSDLTAGRTFDALGMTLTSTDAGASAAPTIDLYRNSASPAASDTIGEIEFNGKDSAGNKQQYALIHGSILSPTSTTEQGQIHFETATAGASTEKMIIGTTNLVINEIGAVFNVRIEGDTDANLFYTDAANSRVGVGTVGPTEKLDVVGGNIRIDNGNLVIGTSGKGIDFSATSSGSGTMTSELLADYEEGTWTPTVKNDNLTTVTGAPAVARYTKIGRIVHCVFVWQRGDAAALTGNMTFNLPFANATGAPYYPGYGTYWATQGSPTYATISSGIVVINAYAANIGCFVRGATSATTNYLGFGATAETLNDGGTVYASFTYETNA